MCKIAQGICAIFAASRQQWSGPLLAYFDTDGASNGGTQAMNGLIELHRRVARGFRNRDNYRLRCLLVACGLTP